MQAAYRMDLYAVILAAGAAVCAVLYFILGRQRRRGLVVPLVLVLGAVFGALFSKVGYIVLQWGFAREEGLRETFLDMSPERFSFFCASAGVILGAVLAALIARRPVREVLDSFAPFGVLLASVARFGEAVLGMYGVGMGTDETALAFFPASVPIDWGDGYVEHYLAVFLLEGACLLAVAVVSFLCFHRHRFIRTLFYLCLPQIFCEALHSVSLVWIIFVRVEQLLPMLVMLGVYLFYALHTPRRTRRRWAGVASAFFWAGIYVACMFALDKTELPDALIYAVMAVGLAGLAWTEHMTYHLMAAEPLK